MPPSCLKMALVNKIQRPQKPDALPLWFGPPLEPGEVLVAFKSAEEQPKKKSKKQMESDALAEHMKNYEVRFKKEQEERMKILSKLPF